jgi:uncharacterized protein YehS (DUF1456 family)
MQNHEILRRVVAAMQLEGDELAALLAATQLPAEPESVEDEALVRFLDALIEQRRGPPPGGARATTAKVNNTLVLKKLRIALGLKDPEMMAIFAKAGLHLSRNEMGAMFRSEDNRHFTPCDDGRLLCFLTGLSRELEG